MRYIIGFLIGLGLIVLLFVLIFKGGNNAAAPAPNTTAKMVDYANTATVVQYTDDFPVNADQTHNQIVVTVGRDLTTATLESGYEGKVVRSKQYENNAQAYANFLRALQLAGFTNGTKEQALQDERGYCPTGHRYIFEIKDGSNQIQRYWSTSCGNIGTFKGKTGAVRNLFIAQVPNYSNLTSTGSSTFTL